MKIFHKNPSSEGRVVTYGEANLTKLIFVTRNFAIALKNEWSQITTTPNATMIYTGKTWYYHFLMVHYFEGDVVYSAVYKE